MNRIFNLIPILVFFIGAFLFSTQSLAEDPSDEVTAPSDIPSDEENVEEENTESQAEDGTNTEEAVEGETEENPENLSDDGTDEEADVDDEDADEEETTAAASEEPPPSSGGEAELAEDQMWTTGLLTSIFALMLGGFSSVLGIWVDRDKRRPVIFAAAMSTLISLAVIMSLIQSIDDAEQNIQHQEDLERMISMVSEIAVNSGDESLANLINQEGGEVEMSEVISTQEDIAEAEDEEGEDAEGEDADGEDADGEDADGEDAEGEDAEGEDAEGEDAEGEDADGEEVLEEEGSDMNMEGDEEEAPPSEDNNGGR